MSTIRSFNHAYRAFNRYNGLKVGSCFGSCLQRDDWLTLRYFSSTSSTGALKELRALSGAPIVDCQKALKHADNNITAAMDWLRKHGAAKASSKVQGRSTTEGLVAVKISDDKKSVAVVRVASETDFASRSSKFVDLVVDVSAATLGSTDNGILAENVISELSLNNKTVKNMLDEAIVAIRENISITDAIKYNSVDGVFVGYVHNKVSEADAGTSAAVVEITTLEGQIVPMETMQTIGKKLAMHVVAARPLYCTPSNVPIEEIQKEKDIITAQLGSTIENKKKEMVDKIVDGKLRKFYESVCLIEQGHMLEEKNPKVGAVLKEHGLTVKEFTLLSIA